jgi:hypothetical protein
MIRIRLIHWKQEECAERAAVLEKLGYGVDFSVMQSASMKEFRENPPDVVVIVHIPRDADSDSGAKPIRIPGGCR